MQGIQPHVLILDVVFDLFVSCSLDFGEELLHTAKPAAATKTSEWKKQTTFKLKINYSKPSVLKYDLKLQLLEVVSLRATSDRTFKYDASIYLLHSNYTALKYRAVQILDAAIRLLNTRHCNKSESTGFSRPRIRHKMHIHHL